MITANGLRSVGARAALGNGVLAALAGALWFLSAPDFDLWPMAWVAMVPTLLVIDRATSVRAAFALAWITGIVANGGGYYWMIGLLVRFGHLPWSISALLFVAMAAYQGIAFGLFGALTRIARTRTGLPMACIAPLAMVTAELVMPLMFPHSVALTQAWQAHVIQVADLAGMAGVTALLLMVSGAVYDVVLARPRRRLPAVSSVVVLSAALLYGHLRMARIDRLRAVAPTLEIGVVQPNLPHDMKGANRRLSAAKQRRDLLSQSAMLEAEGAALVVWPETAFPYAIAHDATGDFPAGSEARIREGFTRPVLFGAIRTGNRQVTGRKQWNSAFLLDRGDTFVGRYDKIYRVLFSEFVPGQGRIALIDKLFRGTSGMYERGAKVVTFDVVAPDGRTWRVGPMICFEDIREDFGRALAQLHPNVLINVTNDSWFGDTSEPWQHLGLSVFRAVETRVDLVRAVNSGVSAFIDANGRVYAKTYAVDPRTRPIGADRLRGTVAKLDGGHTVFAAVGQLFAGVCAALTLGMILVRPRNSHTATAPSRDVHDR